MAPASTTGAVRYGRHDDDIVLVAAAQRGERAALNVLLERHYDRIAAIVRRIIGNQADAADATQEALISITRGLPKFDGMSSFSTWSYRVATNAALDEIRRKGRRPLPDGELVTAAQDRKHTPSEYANVDATADLEKALAKIPVEFRAPVVLRDVCGLDYAEIAEVLNIPGGTVRSRIARARAALAPHMSWAAAEQSDYPETDPAHLTQETRSSGQKAGNSAGSTNRPTSDHHG